MAIRRSAHWFKMLMAKEGTAKMHRNSWWGWVIYIQGIYFKISIIKTVPLSIPHSLIILYTVHSSFYVTLGLDRWFTHTWANLRNSITTLWALIVSSGKKKKNEVQLTFEEQGFELHLSTHMQIFFKYCSTIGSAVDWMNQQIPNCGYGGPVINYTWIFDCTEGRHP